MVMLLNWVKDEELLFKAKSMNYYISEKFNGTRVMYINGELFNREGVKVSNKYPQILQEIREQLPNAVLDGEVAVEKDGKTELYATQLKANWNKARYYIFDMMRNERGEDISDITLNGRLCLLGEQLIETEHLKLVNHTLFSEKSLDFIRKLEQEKREGFVLKSIKSPYLIDYSKPFEEKRTIYWLKYKFLQNYEVDIVGYNEDRKHHSYGSIKTSMGDVGLLNLKNYEIFLSQKPSKAIVRGEAELSINGKILKPTLCYFILNGVKIPVLEELKSELKTQHTNKGVFL